MNLLILGANSDIAYELAKCFAKEKKACCWLASRDQKALTRKVADLKTRYAVEAEAFTFDLCDFSSHLAFYNNLPAKPDLVVLAGGIMSNQQEAQDDFALAHCIIDTNYTGAVSILEIVAKDFETRKQGDIIGISSVAGIRGRADNYLYGSTKAALTTYLSGLRNRLHTSCCHVLTVFPGFIETKMTAHLECPKPLLGKPEKVAQSIYSAYLKRKHIVYTPWIWRLVLGILCAIPEPIFKKIKVR